MISSKKTQLQKLIQHQLFVLFFIMVILLLGLLSYQHRIFRDVTQDNRNTVSESSFSILKQIKGNINITAYAPDDEVLHQNIKNFIARYQRAKPDIQLNIINSAKNPKQAQEVGVRAKGGELIVEYQRRSEHLIPPYSEQELTNVLVRLLRATQQSIRLLNGHGERSFYTNNKHDLRLFRQQLESKGLSLSTLNLITDTGLPKNAAMLIIASPSRDISPTEVAKIKTYLDAGGNLLWLLDNENMHGLDEIAKYIGLEVTQGLVIDKTGSEFGSDIRTAIGMQYGEHPITESLRVHTLFHEAIKISAHGTYENGWKVKELVHVAANGWLETTPLATGADIKNITFDNKKDLPGPINIALAIERKYGKKGQRVVVVGNANFLSNAFIASNGNLEFGVNIINWLAGEDSAIKIQAAILKDGNLNITAESNYKAVFIGFQILLPISLLVFGLYSWWARRKA
jgi:ABC-type uncharacterized transport system involved in gliding motility auxiliary subunit